MYCINTSHPDFQNLLAKSNLNSLALEAEISLWMDKNGDSRYPTLEEIDNQRLGRQRENKNPIRQLGIKYNMNESGFMPSNVPLDQLQRDAAKYNLKVKKAKSGSYYFVGTNSRKINPFYQLESGISEGPEIELRDRLLQWAETHGIEVTAIEEMLERYELDINIESAPVALASLVEKVIAISEEKEKLDTLPEEIAHFATAILKDDASVKKAMENIVNTEVYQQVKEQYKDVYETEEQFRKEAVDKILAEAIVGEFKKENVKEETRGFLQWLKAIISKFLRRIKKVPADAREEIKKDLMPLAQSILAGDYLGEVITKKQITNTPEEIRKNTFFQLEEKKQERLTPEQSKINFARKAIKTLEDNLEIIIRKRGEKDSTGTPRKEVSELKMEIAQIHANLKAAKTDVAILKMVETSKKQFDKLLTHLKSIRESREEIDPHTSDNARKFAEHYSSLFRDFQEKFDFYGFSSEDIKKYNEYFSEIENLISEVHKINDSLSLQIAINAGFDTELFEATAEAAMGWWRLNAGNLKYAKSSIIRRALQLIANSQYATRRATNEAAIELLERQKALDKEGIKSSDFLIKNKLGKHTQTIVQEYDWASYYDALFDAEKKFAKKHKLEDNAKLDKSVLTETQQKEYEDIKADLKKKYLVFDSNLKKYRPKKKSAQYAKLMSNPVSKAYYIALTKLIKQSVDKLPPNKRHDYLYYQVAGIRPQLAERLYNTQGIINNIGQLLKEGIAKDEDDTQFGSDKRLFNNRVVPIYFTQRMEPGVFSTDITRSTIIFFEMAENFKQMNKIAPEMNTVLFHLGKRNYIDPKTGNDTEGKVTNDYKALQFLIDSHIYGVKKDDIKMKILGKEISITKAISSVSSFIRTNNLAFNFATSTAGFIKANIDREIEDRIGLYTTYESKIWAMAEYGRQLPTVISEAYSKTQTSKIQLMMQMTNVVKLDHMIKNSNRNSLMRRIASRDLMFINYHTADFSVKGKATLSIMDNFRLFNGKFIKKSDFINIKEEEGLDRKKDKKTINAEWAALRDKSFWNAYEAVNGRLQIKPEFKKYVTDAEINKITGTVEHLTHYLDGTLSSLDRGQLSTKAAADLLLMHRGWLINMIDTRWGMGDTINALTGEQEMATLSATKLYFSNLYKAWRANESIKMDDLLDPHQKRAVIRARRDFIYLVILGFLVGALNKFADDDEEESWWLQYSAFQMNRVLMEHAAGNPILNPGELLNIIDEPVVGMSTLKSMLDITEAFNDEAVKSGMYKDQAKWAKWWFKKTPFKHLYELQYPEEKNKFMKQIIKSQTYEWFFKEEKDAETVDFTTQLFRLLPGDSFFETEKEAVNTIEILEEEY